MSLDSLMIPLLIALVAVPMFLQARKQKRAMREQQELQNSLTPGDRVMTTSGLYGTVVHSDDDAIELEIAPGVTTTWLRAAVREKVETETEAETETADDVDSAAERDEATEREVVADSTESKATKQDLVADRTESNAKAAEPVEQQKAN